MVAVAGFASVSGVYGNGMDTVYRMPERDLDKLQEEIGELFADLWRLPRFTGMRPGFRPNVDSYRTAEPPELTVVVELPGVDPASVGVVVHEGLLTVTGDRPRPAVAERVYQQMEIEYGRFQRQVRLGEDVDPEGATARYERGVLTVTLPVTPAAETAEQTLIAIVYL
jgi:HSP20 family protein